MPIKIKQKKKPEKQHLSYQPNTGTHWSEEYRDRNKGDFRRSFVAVMVVVVLLLILLITTIIRTAVPEEIDNNAIDAADTFAISQMEQESMVNKAEQFAQGVLVYAYCSDSAVAEQGKTAALMNMANNTAAYKEVENLRQVSPSVAPANFVPIITAPAMVNPTQSYADTFTYEFDGVVVDDAQKDETHPDGMFIDKGYHFEVTFTYVSDETTGEKNWVISDAKITPNYSYGIYAQSNETGTSTTTTTTTTTVEDITDNNSDIVNEQTAPIESETATPIADTPQQPSNDTAVDTATPPVTQN